MLEKLYFDQDMLNLIFMGDWTELPWRFNVMDPRVAHQSMHPFILHYTGRARPWHLYSAVGHRRTYRHVMTNALFYRYMRHRWARSVEAAVRHPVSDLPPICSFWHGELDLARADVHRELRREGPPLRALHL